MNVELKKDRGDGIIQTFHNSKSILNSELGACCYNIITFKLRIVHDIPRPRRFPERSSNSRDNDAFSAALLPVSLFSGQLFLTIAYVFVAPIPLDVSVMRFLKQSVLPGCVVKVAVQVCTLQTDRCRPCNHL